MTYFDDLKIVTVGIYPCFKGRVLERTPSSYSVELVASGRLYFQRDMEPRTVIDYPALRWQSPDHTYNYGAVDDSGWEHYYILMQGERASKLYHEGFEPLVANGCVMPIHRVDTFRNLFTRIHNHLIHPALNVSRAAFYAEELLLYATEELKEETYLTRHLSKLETLTADLRANLGHPVDFRQIAQQMDLSYNHFRRVFKEYAGIPPHQYLLRARLNVAAELLRRTREPIKKIGADLRLGNPAQFSKTFRATFNLPPAAYRRKRLGEGATPRKVVLRDIALQSREG